MMAEKKLVNTAKAIKQTAESLNNLLDYLGLEHFSNDVCKIVSINEDVTKRNLAYIHMVVDSLRPFLKAKIHHMESTERELAYTRRMLWEGNSQDDFGDQNDGPLLG
jgi:DNA-directed RNA polymerase beta subunit